MTDTYFLYDEKSFWHTTRDSVLEVPVGGLLQPLTGLGHVESAETKRRFLSLVHVTGLMDELKAPKTIPATYEQANLVHHSAYLDRLIEQSKGEGGYAGDENTPFGHKGYDYACVSAGLAIHAVDLVLNNKNTNAYALTRPPGHHAQKEHGMGFCMMANIPIAIEVAKQTRPDLRVAVVDWDVHHGNGTQDIFYDRDDVLAISIHQDDCYPRHYGYADQRGTGAGEGYTVNIPLPPATGDGGYVYAMEKIVVPALKNYQPDLIIVASGYDAGITDPLARMMVSSVGFVTMTNMIKDVASTLKAPIMMTHEGGYCVAYTPILAYKTLETLAGSSLNMPDDFDGVTPDCIYAELQPHQKTVIDNLC